MKVIKKSVDGIGIINARRFTKEEKDHSVEWFRELGFVGIGTEIELENITDDDLPKRPEDGSFNGCYNRAWIISDKEVEAYINLNQKRGREKEQEEKEARIAMAKNIIRKAARQGKVYTKEGAREEAKKWNDIHNEGGEGYVPHIITVDEVEKAKRILEDA